MFDGAECGDATFTDTDSVSAGLSAVPSVRGQRQTQIDTNRPRRPHFISPHFTNFTDTDSLVLEHELEHDSLTYSCPVTHSSDSGLFLICQWPSLTVRNVETQKLQTRTVCPGLSAVPSVRGQRQTQIDTNRPRRPHLISPHFTKFTDTDSLSLTVAYS